MRERLCAEIALLLQNVMARGTRGRLEQFRAYEANGS
jgi:hypothetical protein